MTNVLQFNPNRPKTSLRHFGDKGMQTEIKSYGMNRGTQAQPMADKYIMARLEALYSGKPAPVE